MERGTVAVESRNGAPDRARRTDVEGPYDPADYPMGRPVLPLDAALSLWPWSSRPTNPDLTADAMRDVAGVGR